MCLKYTQGLYNYLTWLLKPPEVCPFTLHAPAHVLTMLLQLIHGPWWTYQKWYYCKSTLFPHGLCNDTIWWTTSPHAQVMHPSLHCRATYCLWHDICDHSDYRYVCFTFKCVNVEHIKLTHHFSIASCCASHSWVSHHHPVIDTATNSGSATLSVLQHGVRNS